MTTPQPSPPQPPPGPAGGQDDSERIARLEAHQQTVDGKLDKILEAIKPGGGAADPVTQPAAAPAAAPDIGEQMRQAVRDVAAEQASAAPAQPPTETPPREIGVKGKTRLQGRLFGKDPAS